MRFYSKRKTTAKASPRNKGQAGFTLIELLISMLLFLIVTATVYGLLEMGA